MKFKKLMAAVTTGVLAVTSLSLSGLIGSAEVQELMNDTFESGYGAWKGVGSSLSLSTEQAHNGGTSLYCYDRTANWGAPRCSLTGIVAAGQSYEISASAMYEGSGQQNMAIKMIYTDANGTDHYDQVAAAQATAGQWVEIKGNYTVPSGATDMILYVEMPSANTDQTYYIDDVVIKGEKTEIQLDDKFNEAIEQGAYICYEGQKLGIVREMFSRPSESKTIIFSSSKLKVKELAHTLKRMKLDVAPMHSDLDQEKREQVMLDFKNNKVRILVATDIVARGIDIEDIGMVINYDVPHDPEDYIHRIGRTARASATGRAVTFVNEEEQGKFHRIEEFIEREIPKLSLPEAVGAGPEYNPAAFSGHGGRRGRSGSGRGGNGRSGGRGRSRGRDGAKSAGPVPAEGVVAAANVESRHGEGRGEGNRGSRDRGRRRNRNRNRNRNKGGDDTPQA